MIVFRLLDICNTVLSSIGLQFVAWFFNIFPIAFRLFFVLHFIQTPCLQGNCFMLILRFIYGSSIVKQQLCKTDFNSPLQNLQQHCNGSAIVLHQDCNGSATALQQLYTYCCKINNGYATASNSSATKQQQYCNNFLITVAKLTTA